MSSNRLIITIVAACGAIALSVLGSPVSSAAPAGPAPEAGCTLQPNPHISKSNEFASCLSVSASIERAPELGESAVLAFDVTSQLGSDAVRIEADLPGNLRWESAPAGLQQGAVASASPMANGHLERASGLRAIGAGKSVHFEGTVSAVSAGAAEIRVRARIAVPGGTDVAEDFVFLTIGEKGQASVATIDTPAVGTTTAVTKAAAPAAQDKRRVVPMAGQASAVPGPLATSCATGGWFYVDNVGATRPSINATVEVRSGSTLLATGITSFNGSYSVCFSNIAAGRNVFVRFIMKNTIWRLRVTGTNNDYIFSTGTLFAANGANVNFGNLQPGDAASMRGLHAFDAANDAWNFKPGTCWATLHTTCRQLNINWSNTSTDGTFYSPSGNDVHLAAADPDSATTVVHEVGHGVMDETYNDSMPSSPNCNPHTIQGASSAGCAWVEGWAEWFPASVYNDPFFRWPDGGSLNLETPNASTPGWDDGDTVEGRVAGSLIDVSDFANDGFDTFGEGDPGNIWTTFSNHRSTTFANFWSQRAGDGFNVSDPGALASLFQNSIDY